MVVAALDMLVHMSTFEAGSPSGDMRIGSVGPALCLALEASSGASCFLFELTSAARVGAMACAEDVKGATATLPHNNQCL